MQLTKVRELLEATVVVGHNRDDIEIVLACGCDLMSDVLTFCSPGALLLTGLTNAQVVRTAEMADIACVCFIRGKMPQPETLSLAEEKDIVVLSTRLSMLEACGRLYNEGLHGCSVR
jgi:hypothetical protein